MTSLDYFAILPQIILVLAGMMIMLLEPFTPKERKSQLGQIAVIAAFGAAFALSFQKLQSPVATLPVRKVLVEGVHGPSERPSLLARVVFFGLHLVKRLLQRRTVLLGHCVGMRP